jgi:dGTPase
MQWVDYFLLAKNRLFDTYKPDKTRSEFQKDYDRIVFSSAFRRLQNKTQVLPFPTSDYVRNRLTHSLETASVGRSLGNLVGEKIVNKYPDLSIHVGINPADFGHLVSAACLTHDIGNPPFGHSGEKAISQFFKSEKAIALLKDLSEKEKADLQNFEGNASGFRIITQTPSNISDIKGGLRLTLGTYATFVKYPKESLPNRKKEGKASLKKFGIYQSEIDLFENEIAQPLHLIPQENKGGKAWKRFPLTYLVEAADDICYHIIDLEDGFNMGFVPFNLVEELFTNLIDKNNHFYNRYHSIKSYKEKVNYLRSMAVNQLVNDTARIFIDNEQSFVNGEIDTPLLDLLSSDKKDILKNIIAYSIEHIYQSEPVLKIEIAGQKVLPDLLDKFTHAIMEPEYNKQLYKLIPEKYKGGQSTYENLLNIAMFISDMTDRKAVEIYKNLNGISLAGY